MDYQDHFQKLLTEIEDSGKDPDQELEEFEEIEEEMLENEMNDHFDNYTPSHY